jgi:excisionase family DNA binding protein
MNGYLSVKEAAERWNITERQVQRLCAEGRIPGVIQFAGSWAIPEDTVKPTRTGKLKPGPKPKTEKP